MRLESRLSLQQEVGWDRDTIRMARYLAESQSSPFVVSTPGNIKNQLETWRANFPGIQPTFDVGSGCLAESLYTLSSLSVPCHFMSKPQMQSLLDSGLSGSCLNFSNSVKLGSHIRAAKEAQVNVLYCDSIPELAKIKKHHPNSSIILEVNRYKNGNDSSLAAESGAAWNEIPEIVLKGQELGLGIRGIAVTAGQLDCLDPDEHCASVSSSLEFALNVLKLIGQVAGDMKISSVHLPQLCPFWLFNRHPEFVNQVESLVNSSGILLKEGLNVSSDATDFLVSNSVTLAAMIIDVKSSLDVGIYQIEEGVFGCFSSNLSVKGENDVCAPLPLGGGKNRKGLSAKLLVTNILGPSGDDLDVVVEDIVLQRMEVGDWLLFPNIGSKNLSEFNGGKSVKGSQASVYIKANNKGKSGASAYPDAMLDNSGGAGVKTVLLDENEENRDTSVTEGLRGELVELEDTFINDVM